MYYERAPTLTSKILRCSVRYWSFALERQYGRACSGGKPSKLQCRLKKMISIILPRIFLPSMTAAKANSIFREDLVTTEFAGTGNYRNDNSQFREETATEATMLVKVKYTNN